MPRRTIAGETFDEGLWQAFAAELQGSSDRASALAGAAILDALLGQLITAFMVDDQQDEVQWLLSGPLGTLRSRIATAYSLGLISEDELRDLKTITAMRNEFAHGLPGISFNRPDIADKCQALVLPDLLNKATGLASSRPFGRQRFINAVAMLATFLSQRRDRTTERRQVARNYHIDLTREGIAAKPERDGQQG